MAAKFVTFSRDTAMLLPPDLRDWAVEDDLVYFVIEAFHINERGSGSAQMPLHMMLAATATASLVPARSNVRLIVT